MATLRIDKLINLDNITIRSSCLIYLNVLPKINNVDSPQLLNSVASQVYIQQLQFW